MMDFYLQNYWLLLLLAFVPMVGMLLFRYNKWRVFCRARFAESRFRENIFQKSGWFAKVFPWLYLPAMVFLILALLDILGGREEVKSTQHIGNVIFMLDVSNSMNAEDIQPNRLSDAKNILIKTLPKLQNDRVGVVVFAGEATSIMPLTTDFNAAETYISGVETSVVQIQGTDFLKGMQVAVSKFKNVPKGARQIILLSDGEDNEGNDKQAVNLANKEGVTVHTVGIGSEQGAPVPEYRYGQLMGYKTDGAGQTIVSQRQEGALKNIAEATGGLYIDGNNLTDASAQIATAVAKNRNGSAMIVKSRNANHYYQYFLSVALFLFLIIYLFNPNRDFNF